MSITIDQYRIIDMLGKGIAMIRKISILTALVLLMFLITSCDNDNDKVSDENSVKIYYIDSISNEIVSEKYHPVETEKEELVYELLQAIQTEPKNDIYRSALPNNVKINNAIFSQENGLSIDFDSAYNELMGIPEVLCRAAVVKTLSQIDGVEYVQFNVNGQPLKDSNSVIVNLMTEDDFIESIGDETNYKVSLFYTNEYGDSLIEHITNIYYYGTSSIEELVINQLINGPTDIGMYHTIPEGTVLIDVNTKDGICYVDFNEKFLENGDSIADEVVIYSVVNSLVELPNITKVQFLINGEVRKTYQENVAFDDFFERNLNLVKDRK
jgi:germination protein M